MFYQKLYIIIFDFFLDMNQCLYNPCQNGGTFTQNDGCFTWTCKDGYVGTLCNEGKHISPPPPLCKRKYLALVFLFISSTHELNVDVYPLLFMCVCIFLLFICFHLTFDLNRVPTCNDLIYCKSVFK